MSAHRQTLCLGGGAVADPDLGIGDELIGRQRQIERRRPLTDAAGRIVLRAVAGAEPAVIIALMRQRNASEMRTDTNYYQPLLVARFDARRIGSGIAECLPIG